MTNIQKMNVKVHLGPTVKWPLKLSELKKSQNSLTKFIVGPP
jgi:hypothetical protein